MIAPTSSYERPATSRSASASRWRGASLAFASCTASWVSRSSAARSGSVSTSATRPRSSGGLSDGWVRGALAHQA